MSEPFHYKIMFTFDMPNGRKNDGITDKPDALYWIWRLYRENNGSNLVVKDKTDYKEDDGL